MEFSHLAATVVSTETRRRLLDNGQHAPATTNLWQQRPVEIHQVAAFAGREARSGKRGVKYVLMLAELLQLPQLPIQPHVLIREPARTR